MIIDWQPIELRLYVQREAIHHVMVGLGINGQFGLNLLDFLIESFLPCLSLAFSLLELPVFDRQNILTGKAIYLAVMVVAGPSVLFDNAARSRRKKECSTAALGIASAISLYWSLAIGLFVVELALALFRHH